MEPSLFTRPPPPSPTESPAPATSIGESTPKFVRPPPHPTTTPGGAEARSDAAGVEPASPSVFIPPSPMMKKLGLGTGVSVYLLQRSPKQGTYCSPWAVKKVNRNYRNKPLANRRVEAEGRILKDLAHPNLIGFRGLRRLTDGNVALLMETGGRALMDHIDERLQDSDPTPFPAPAVLQLGGAVARGLAYLHAQGVLHGDVKSGNILVRNSAWAGAKLCDFGTALPLGPDMRAADPEAEYIGTEAWSAPEVLDANRVTDRADVFALGMVLYEMLSLSVPHMAGLGPEEMEEDEQMWEEAWLARLGTRPELPREVVEDARYGPAVDFFLMCSEEQSERRPSAAQLVALMEAAAGPGQ